MADNWLEIDRYLRALGVRFGAPTVGQTTGGIHAEGSWHYAGQARDYGQSNSDLRAILAALEPHAVSGVLVELYGINVYWKNGQPLDPSPGLFDAHQDHVHAALRPGATLPAVGGAMEGKKIIAFEVTPDGRGYWFVTEDGAVYAFGSATYHGRIEFKDGAWKAL